MKRLEFIAVLNGRRDWRLRLAFALADVAAGGLLLRLLWLWFNWFFADSDLYQLLFWRSCFLWIDWIGLALAVLWVGFFAWRLWRRFIRTPRCPACRARLIPQAGLVLASGHCGGCGAWVLDDHGQEPLPSSGLLAWSDLLRAAAIANLAVIAWGLVFGTGMIVFFYQDRVALPDCLGSPLVFFACLFLTFMLSGLWLERRFCHPCPACGKPLGWIALIRITGHCPLCGCQVCEMPLPPASSAPLLPRQELVKAWPRLVWANRLAKSFGVGMVAILFLAAIFRDAESDVREWFWIFIAWVAIWSGIKLLSRWFGRKCPSCHRLLTLSTLPAALAAGRCLRCGGRVVADDLAVTDVSQGTQGSQES